MKLLLKDFFSRVRSLEFVVSVVNAGFHTVTTHGVLLVPHMALPGFPLWLPQKTTKLRYGSHRNPVRVATKKPCGSHTRNHTGSTSGATVGNHSFLPIPGVSMFSEAVLTFPQAHTIGKERKHFRDSKGNKGLGNKTRT